jgi:hypothetical protein
MDMRAIRGKLLAGVAVAAAAVSAPAHAALITYTGADAGAGSLATAPKSVAAATSFDAAVAALGNENTLTFESSALGSFASLTLASGISLTGADVNGHNQSIVNTTSNINISPPCSNALCGYNTTVGGSNFLLLFGGTGTFSFSAGTDAFGAYVAGVQNGGETVTFSDGTSQSVAIANPGFGGGTVFVGFIDADKSITSVTINVNNDVVGVDDVRYVTSSVPEPASLALLGGALTGLALMTRRRKLNIAASTA